MEFRLLAKLLFLSVLGHQVSLLAGQHFSVNKCTYDCSLMNGPKIAYRFLKTYTESQPSCRHKAVIFTTKKNRTFCADPKEKWVQEAIQFLNNAAAAAAATAAQKQTAEKENAGTFEKLTGENGPSTIQLHGEGDSVPSTPLDPRVTDAPLSTTTKPSPSPTSAFLEEELVLETSPGLPASTAGSSVSLPDPLLMGSTSSTVGRNSPDPLQVSQGTEASNMEDVSAAVTPTLESSDSNSLAKANVSEDNIVISHPGKEEGDTVRFQDHPEQGDERGLGTKNPIISEKTSTVFAFTSFSGSAEDSAEHHSSTPISASESPSSGVIGKTNQPYKVEEPPHATADLQSLKVSITPIPDSPQAATRRQAFGLLAFLGFLFCLGVAMFAYQSLQSCPRRMAGEVVEGLRYIPRSCGSNSYVLVPV